MMEEPKQIDWTCKLLEWHGLYQHPYAKDKERWYVHPEHAVANAEDEAINEWSIFGSQPSYTSDVIRRIIEAEQPIAPEDKVVELRCNYECSNYHRAVDGETCMMWLGAENGPVIEGYGGVGVEYIGVFDAATREYVWHPRTPIDEAIVSRYFHHIPTQKELNFMCYEGGLFGLDDLFAEPEKSNTKDDTEPENVIYLGCSENQALKRNLSEL